MGKITFLGTGTSQGVPMIGCSCHVCTSTDKRDNRLRTSALIEHNGLKILIDCGPDFRQQMLRENIKDIDAVILTHQHKDHTGGLDDIRAFNYFRNAAFPIYAEKRVQDSLKMEYSYAFAENKYPGVPEYDLRTIDEKPFSIKKADGNIVNIIPIRVMHHKLPILGFKIDGLVYITDANYIANEELCKMQNANIFVINAIRKERHLSHFSLPEALEVAQKVGAAKTYITHLSHQIGTHAELMQELPQGIEPAYDGLKCEF